MVMDVNEMPVDMMCRADSHPGSTLSFLLAAKTQKRRVGGLDIDSKQDVSAMT
jgi:hypothetical protein